MRNIYYIINFIKSQYRIKYAAAAAIYRFQIIETSLGFLCAAVGRPAFQE